MKYLILLLCALFTGNVIASEGSDNQETESPVSRKAYIHHKKGLNAFELELYELAEAEFSLAIAAEPNNLTYYYDRGSARYLLQKYRAAIKDFDRFLDGNPDQADVVFLRGLSKSLTNPQDVAGACKDFKIAELLGENLDVVNGLAEYCSDQEGWK